MPGAAAIRWEDFRAHSGPEQEPELIWMRARIDNRAELLADLTLPAKTPDDALLIALYRKFAEQCADHILGDFAFCISDPARGHIYCARDIMGCQPLYYSANATGFFIAEHIADLLKFEEVSQAEDAAFIAAFLSYNFAHSERTCFAEVRKLPPAHFAIIREGALSLTRYWDPATIEPRKWQSHEECLGEFRALVRQAIADRLPAEGPVGVHVSGGLDSSTIGILTAEIMAEQGRPAPLALTWYPAPRADMSAVEAEEYERLGAACGAMGVSPLYTEQSADNVLQILSWDHRIKPICNASYNEALSLAQAKDRGVRVILSGFGGDEAATFDGRGYTYELAQTGKWRTLSDFARISGKGVIPFILSQLVRGLAHRFLSDDRLREVEYGMPRGRARQIAKLALLLLPKAWRQRGGDPAEDNDLPYLNPALAEQVEPLPRMPMVRYTTSFQARCNLLSSPALLVRIEPWHTQSADYGISYAYPLLDRRILEFVLALPGSVFRNPEWKRLFFRQAMEKTLPPEVCWRHVKADPARSTPLIEAMIEAYGIVGQRYRDGCPPPDRARYIDLDRLLKDIKRAAQDRLSGYGNMFNAFTLLGGGEDR